MNKKSSMTNMRIKIGFYLFASLLIGLEAQIDTINNIDSLTVIDWCKFIIKSILPTILAMKALFDTSVSNYFKKDDLE